MDKFCMPFFPGTAEALTRVQCSSWKINWLFLIFEGTWHWPNNITSMTILGQKTTTTHYRIRILNNASTPIHHACWKITIPDICSNNKIYFLSLLKCKNNYTTNNIRFNVKIWWGRWPPWLTLSYAPAINVNCKKKHTSIAIQLSDWA
jgi:hypothetical protein